MIAPTLLKAILKFCTSNKFLNLKTYSLKTFKPNLATFQHLNVFWTRPVSMQRLIGRSKNNFVQTLLNLSNLAYFLIALKTFKM